MTLARLLRCFLVGGYLLMAVASAVSPDTAAADSVALSGGADGDGATAGRQLLQAGPIPSQYAFLAGRTFMCVSGWQWDYRITFFDKVEQVLHTSGAIAANTGFYSSASADGKTLFFTGGDSCGGVPRTTTVELHCASFQFAFCGEPNNAGCAYKYYYYSPDLCIGGVTVPAPRQYQLVPDTEYPFLFLNDVMPACFLTLAQCTQMCNDIPECAMYEHGSPYWFYNDCCWLKHTIANYTTTIVGLMSYLPTGPLYKPPSPSPRPPRPSPRPPRPSPRPPRPSPRPPRPSPRPPRPSPSPPK